MKIKVTFLLLTVFIINTEAQNYNHPQSFDAYGWGQKTANSLIASIGKYSESYIVEYDLTNGNFTYLNDSNDYRLSYMCVHGDTGVAVTGSNKVIYTYDNWKTLNESSTFLSKIIATDSGFVGVRKVSSTIQYYHSVDGNNWTQVTGLFAKPENAFSYKDGKTWVGGDPSKIQVSNNGGASFTNFTPNTYPSGETFTDFIPLDTLNIIAVSNQGKWYLSTNGAQNWTYMTNVPVASSFVYANQLDTMYAKTLSGLQVSIDTGNTWQASLAPFPGTNPTRSYDIGNHIITVISHFGQKAIYSNNYIGNAWYQLQKRHSQVDVFDVNFDGNVGAIVGEDGEYAYSPNKGKTYYTGSTTLGSEDLFAVEVYGNKVLVANRQSDIYYSNDAGVNFTQVYNNTNNAVPDKFKASADLSTIVLFGDALNLISNDTGQTWNTVGTLGGGTMDGTVTPSGKLLMFVSVFTSSNQVQIEEMNKANGNRTVIKAFSETDLQAVALEMVDENRGYAVARNSSTQELVFFSTVDGWSSYTNLGSNSSMPNMRAALNLIGNDTLILNFFNTSASSFSDNRLFKSVNGGVAWTVDSLVPIKQGGSTDKLQKLHFFTTNMFVSVWEDGRIYQHTSNQPILTSIEEDLTIEKTSLRVYPNPFNNYLNIESQEKISSITIIDLSGKIIRKEEVNSTKYKLGFDLLRGGVYFVRIEQGEIAETIKIIKQ